MPFQSGVRVRRLEILALAMGLLCLIASKGKASECRFLLELQATSVLVETVAGGAAGPGANGAHARLSEHVASMRKQMSAVVTEGYFRGREDAFFDYLVELSVLSRSSLSPAGALTADARLPARAREWGETARALREEWGCADGPRGDAAPVEASGQQREETTRPQKSGPGEEGGTRARATGGSGERDAGSSALEPLAINWDASLTNRAALVFYAVMLSAAVFLLAAGRSVLPADAAGKTGRAMFLSDPRAHERHSCQITAEIDCEGVRDTTHIVNISPWGASLLRQDSMVHDARIALRLPAVTVTGTIVWTGQKTCGVEFDAKLDEAALERVLSYDESEL